MVAKECREEIIGTESPNPLPNTKKHDEDCSMYNEIQNTNCNTIHYQIKKIGRFFFCYKPKKTQLIFSFDDGLSYKIQF